MRRVVVTFERVGRHHVVPPLAPINDIAGLQALAELVYFHVRRYLGSSGVEVICRPDGSVQILAGFRDAGRGRWTADEVDEGQVS